DTAGQRIQPQRPQTEVQRFRIALLPQEEYAVKIQGLRRIRIQRDGLPEFGLRRLRIAPSVPVGDSHYGVRLGTARVNLQRSPRRRLRLLTAFAPGHLSTVGQL